MIYNYHYYKQGSFGTGIIREEEGEIEANTPKSLKQKIGECWHLRHGNWGAWKTLANGTLVKRRDLEFGGVRNHNRHTAGVTYEMVY